MGTRKIGEEGDNMLEVVVEPLVLNVEASTMPHDDPAIDSSNNTLDVVVDASHRVREAMVKC